MKESKIQCPECGKEIDVDAVMHQQLHDQLRKEFNTKLAAEQKKIEEQNAEVRRQKTEIEKQRIDLEESISKGVKQKLLVEKTELEKKLRLQIADEKSEEIRSYQEQLQLKINEARELNKVKAEFSKLQREKEELKEKLEAEAEVKINQTLSTEKEKIKKELEEKNQLKVSEKDHVIEQLKEQLTIAQRKAEQGSMQVQGEVQELAIEAWLKSNFPWDTIEEIKKGAKGADCAQIVNTVGKQNCGIIYYESKRTKDFQPAWIEKFKTDMRQKGARFGVLVTDVLPKDMSRMGLRDGIWICSFEEFKGLCFVLRESVILLDTAAGVQENKGEKMTQLYDYLTGNEFRMQVEAIVEGFTQMQTDLDAEKRAMESIWKKREKQITKVILNTGQMYGSVKGIAGNSIGAIKSLELPDGSSEEKKD